MTKAHRYNITRLHLKRQDNFVIPEELAHEEVPEGFPEPKKNTMRIHSPTEGLSEIQAAELEEKLVASGHDISATSDDLSDRQKQRSAQLHAKPCQFELMNVLSCWRQSGTDNPKCAQSLRALQDCAKTMSVCLSK
jgi:hypothetical protein